METRLKHAGSGEQLNERLAHSGLRLTPQRQRVHDVLLEKQDHPTADQVFFRAKSDMPDISMATVYNCLDALVQCGLVKQVTLDRGATRFCPNMQETRIFTATPAVAFTIFTKPSRPRTRRSNSRAVSA